MITLLQFIRTVDLTLLFSFNEYDDNDYYHLVKREFI